MERFPMDRACPFAPPAAYAELREGGLCPAVELYDGRSARLVTRYDQVRELLLDKRFSADNRVPGYPEPAASTAAIADRSLIRMDPPEHQEHRRMLTRHFIVRKVEALRPAIEAQVDALLDGLLERGGPVDIVEALALPVATLALCDLLGVPYEDRAMFQERAKTWNAVASTPEEARAAATDLMAYLEDRVARLESGEVEGEGLIRELVDEWVRPGLLSRPDAVTDARLLLVAGHETTANTIALGVVTLLQHPEQAAMLSADPSLARSAVEELLRYHSVAQVSVRRVALDDVEVGGHLIRAGEGVFALVDAANRDPAVFEDPDRFDITRDARHHVGFGFGPHQCLGQPLARLELRVVFERIFARIPDLRLAVPCESLRFKTDAVVYGIHELPVTWGP